MDQNTPTNSLNWLNPELYAKSQSTHVAHLSDLIFSGAIVWAPTYANTCYSLIDPDYAVSVAAVYRFEGGDIKSVSSGVSPKGADKDFHRNEARFDYGWYQAITSEAFAG